MDENGKKPGWGQSPAGELFEKWPKDEGGKPVPSVCIARCAGIDIEAELLISMLGAYGIPAFCAYPGDGAFGKLIMGVSGTGVDVCVPETMAEKARELMEAKPDETLV